MIESFNDKETEKIFKGERSRKLPDNIQNLARRKLRMLNNSQNLNDLKVPPSNYLKKLKGSEFYSIRINLQWRICFNWENNNAKNVEIIDYH